MQNCSICGEYDDSRHVTVECFYAVDEIVPRAKRETRGDCPNYFTIQCCKSCRADFMQMFKEWAEPGIKAPDNPEADIPVRVNGATKMMTEEEYENYRKEKENEE